MGILEEFGRRSHTILIDGAFRKNESRPGIASLKPT
jgi:hypothetical protein